MLGFGPTGEEDIDIVASDLRMEPRGSIDRGLGFGIEGGDLVTASGSGIENWFVEEWLDTIEDCRDNVCDEIDLVDRSNELLPLNSFVLAEPAIMYTVCK